MRDDNPMQGLVNLTRFFLGLLLLVAFVYMTDWIGLKATLITTLVIACLFGCGWLAHAAGYRPGKPKPEEDGTTDPLPVTQPTDTTANPSQS